MVNKVNQDNLVNNSNINQRRNVDIVEQTNQNNLEDCWVKDHTDNDEITIEVTTSSDTLYDQYYHTTTDKVNHDIRHNSDDKVPYEVFWISDQRTNLDEVCLLFSHLISHNDIDVNISLDKIPII